MLDVSALWGLTTLQLAGVFPTSRVSPVIDSPGHAVPLTPTASSGDPKKVMHVSRQACMLEHSRSLERLLILLHMIPSKDYHL